MVPFVDLKTQHLHIKDELQAAIGEVLDSATFVLGPAVTSFEKKFAAYVKTRHAIGVNSGTSALHLAFLALGICPGDEVIAPAMTFVATVSAIEYAGARPVLVDVEPESFTLDPERLEAAITPRTRAVVPVHLYGHPADMAAILEIARAHRLSVVEDAAQAHGATYHGRPCGSLGDIAAFSFYPGKNLGACGEAGAVATRRDDLARRVRTLRDWGQEAKGDHGVRGFNYRMDGVQGAVLAVKMKYLEDWIARRRRAAARYRELLAGGSGLAVPAEQGQVRHAYHVFPVLVGERDRVRRKLGHAGISTGIHYPTPVHLQRCFSDLGYSPGDFPVAERLAREEISLPMFPELTERQIVRVVHALKGALDA